MALLDKANTETYGTPEPTDVTLTVEKGPFIVVTGHDLKDLQLLLEQTEGKGINIYTHGEMLPAHAYPFLKKFSHLKGNFGTAWQNQQKEFDHLPAPILYTTNCLMPPKSSYADRVFTTEVVAFPGAVHIDEKKDFTPVIEKEMCIRDRYEAVFKDAIKIPSMQDKKLKEYIITKLRENGDLKRIYRNIFISYITKNLDNYIKYFDEALQWVKKNNIKSDEMAQWIKENNIQ